MALVILKNEQVASLCNDSLKNTLGDNATILQEDLSNVIDVGTSLANANAYGNFLENLMVATAKYIFRFRKYESKAPNVLRDSQEYGQLIQKIRSKLPALSNNQSWDLQDQASYDDNVYIANDAEVTIFKERDTFEVRKSITNEQLKNAFTSATELGSFVSMQFGLVENRLILALDDLIYMSINNYMGELIHANKNVVHLLTDYKNDVPGADVTLTSDTCWYDEGFLIYAGSIIMDYVGLMQRYSTQFNAEGFETFTPASMLHTYLASKFVANMDTYAKADTFNAEFLKLPKHETFEFLQGLGDKSIKDRTTIDIKVASDGTAVKEDYILGFLFDHDALGVNHDRPSVETKYVRSGQFTNYWYKEVVGYFNDLSENAVLFIAD